jgi:hypothetical protein
MIFIENARYSSQILKKLEVSRHIFEKKKQILNLMNTIQWESSISIRAEAQTHRRTDRHSEANSHFS